MDQITYLSSFTDKVPKSKSWEQIENLVRGNLIISANRYQRIAPIGTSASLQSVPQQRTNRYQRSAPIGTTVADESVPNNTNHTVL